MLERIARLGIAPGKTFDMASFTPEVQKAIEEGVADGIKLMNGTPRGKDVNGWNIALDLGRYGTQYPYRAGWTFYGVGGNLAEDAVYPVAEKQADGKPFEGGKKYVLHFSKDEIPPVDAFWSVTMYDKESYLVPNAINRYALGDRSGMKPGEDGSLTHLHPARVARQGQGKQLAAIAEGRPVQARAALVHAQEAGRRWHLDSAGGQAGRLRHVRGRAACARPPSPPR